MRSRDETVMQQTKPKADPAVILPDPEDPRLTERVTGIDHTGAIVEVKVPVERALTLYLNAQEIVTMMTINDYPEYLALGYLLNQNMLKPDDVVTGVDYDDDLQVVVVRTERHTNYEHKLKKRTLTSGCAQGTAFGDLMEALEEIDLPDAELRTSWLYEMTEDHQHHALALSRGRRHPWLRAVPGGPAALLHGGCRPPQRRRQDGRLDVPPRCRSGRQDPLHDRPADLGNDDQDRSHGHTHPRLALRLHRLGRLARPAGRADAGRAARAANASSPLSGEERIVFDQDPASVEEEAPRHHRKGAEHDD